VFGELLIRIRCAIQALFHRARIDGEMEEELRAHIQNRADDLERGGLGRREALRRARLEFGGYQKFKEESREAMGTHFFETLAQDVRYAIRTLRKAPGFAAVAIFTLALGIGANTTLFSVVNGVLLKALPYPNPNELFSLYWRTEQDAKSAFSFPDFLDYQKQNRAFASMAAYYFQDHSLLGAGTPELLRGAMVSADFFPLLGIKPLLGRAFRSDEDKPGGPPVVVIGERLWKQKFNSSPNVLGTTINLDGEIYTIVGVVPSDLSFFDPLSIDMLAPIGQWNDASFRDRRVHLGTFAVARLRPGVSFTQARADMDSVAENLANAYPEIDKNVGVTIVPLKEDIVGDVRRILLVLLGAVGFVLLIACANVANLFLVRFGARRPEFAVRCALGAGSARIIRQLLTESVLLGLASGILGLAMAKWGTKAILATVPGVLPRAVDIRVDAHVLIFTLTASVLTGILFGLAPAIRAFGPDLSKGLKEGGRSSSNAARLRVHGIFVVAELAISIVLLTGAGLMLRSFAEIWRVNPGFNSHHVLNFDLSFSASKRASIPATRRAFREFTADVESVPGIEAASGLGGSLPTTGTSTMPFWIDGRTKPLSETEMNIATWYAVQPDYLKTLQISLIRGRFISREDNKRSPSVVVIDETFARQYFPDQDPIGKRIHTELMGPLLSEIIGVVGHTKQSGLGEAEIQNREPQFYFALDQIPDHAMPLFTGLGMIVRTSGDPIAYIPSIRAASEKFDDGQIIADFQPLDKLVSESVATQRFVMILLAAFALVALLLSAVGVYGVISYLVGQRTHEIGLRMALGAQRADIVNMILLHVVRFAFLGIALGLAGSFSLMRLLRNYLFGVSTNDPLTLGAVTMLLTAVALAACYLPARRAMCVDPMVALRYE
jgi:predicted permease